MAKYAFYTYTQRPDLVEQANSLNPTAWPEFMLHDAVANRLWHRLEETLRLDGSSRGTKGGN